METIYVRSTGTDVEAVRSALEYGYWDTREAAEADNPWLEGDQDYIIEVEITVARKPIK